MSVAIMPFPPFPWPARPHSAFIVAYLCCSDGRRVCTVRARLPKTAFACLCDAAVVRFSGPRWLSARVFSGVSGSAYGIYGMADRVWV